MHGYKVRTIKNVDVSQDILVVSFVDTHGQEFNLPCICERFKELVTSFSPAQLQNILNESKITVFFSHGVIRTINLEPPPGGSTAGTRIPGPANHEKQSPIDETQVIQSTSAETKPDHLRDPFQANSKEGESWSTSQWLAPLSMTPEERRQLAKVDERRRQIEASQVMFCPSCESVVPVRREKRGQFRRQFYCSKCDKLIETIDDAD